jgi:predicted RNase H-like nuclease
MSIIAGVDGCPGGWICIVKDQETGAVTSAVYPTAEDLFSHTPTPEVLAIDIPIGLTEAGPRQCDQEARKLLGTPRRSSVFPVPIRPALEVQSRPLASAITLRADGRKVGIQSWAIFPKIHQIDEVLRAHPQLQSRVREVHPELSFWAWNGKTAMTHRKKSAKGRAERRQLIDGIFGRAAVDKVRAIHPANEVGIDDIHDAFAALWTAQRISEGTTVVIPKPSPRDSKELRMEIWY